MFCFCYLFMFNFFNFFGLVKINRFRGGITTLIKRFSTINNKEAKFINTNINIIYFEFEGFHLDILAESLNKYVKPGNRYSFLLKVKNVNGDYGMAGNQVKFEFSSFDYNEEIIKLYKQLKTNLNIFRKKYLGVDILHIQLMFITVNSFPELEIKNINKVK